MPWSFGSAPATAASANYTSCMPVVACRETFWSHPDLQAREAKQSVRYRSFLALPQGRVVACLRWSLRPGMRATKVRPPLLYAVVYLLSVRSQKLGDTAKHDASIVSVLRFDREPR